MKQKQTIFIYSNGRVAAISKTNGEIIWEVKLKEYVKSSIAYAIGSIQAEGDKLFVAVSGVMVCLRTKDGSLVWKNELKGWGYNFVSFCNISNDVQACAEQANAAAMANIMASSSVAT